MCRLRGQPRLPLEPGPWGMTSPQPEILNLGIGAAFSSDHPSIAENYTFNYCFHKSSEPVGASLS